MLAVVHDPANVFAPDDVKIEMGAPETKTADYFRRGYPVLLNGAESGEQESRHLISLYFQTGTPPASIDMAQCKHWREKATKAGYKGAGQL